MSKNPTDAQARSDAAAPQAAAPHEAGLLSRLFSGFAFMLALLATAAAAFAWWQYRSFYVSLHGADLELEASLERVRANQRAFEDRLEAMGVTVADARGRAERAAERVEALPQRIDHLEGSLDGVSERVAAAERRAAALAGGSGDAEAAWVRAEVEYYLTLANAELTLAGRWDNAITALDLADRRLRTLADPALSEVRRQIAADRLALASVEQPDIEGVVFDLSSIAERIDALPLRGESADAASGEPGGAEAAEPEPGLARLGSRVADAMNSLIRIEKRDEAAPRRAAAERRATARRELAAELALARAGAVRAEPAVYRAALDAAADLLARDFDTASAGVQAAAERVAALRRIDVAPQRPDISGSLTMLRRTQGLDDPPAADPPGQAAGQAD